MKKRVSIIVMFLHAPHTIGWLNNIYNCYINILADELAQNFAELY